MIFRRMCSLATNAAIGPPSRTMPWTVRNAVGSGAKTVGNLGPPSFRAANVQIFPRLVMNASVKERHCVVSAQGLTPGIPAVVATATIAKSVMLPCAKAAGLIMTATNDLQSSILR